MKTLGKISVIILAVYLTLTMLPFPINYMPIVGYQIINPFSQMMNSLATWVGLNIFKLHNIPQTAVTGSGDTLMTYLSQFVFLSGSIFFAVLIALFRKIEVFFVKLEPFIKLLLKYWLASTLIFYGVSKFLPVQMSGLSLIQLVQSYGDMSPMGVLWRFMGLSPYYQSFTGLVELLAGLFLCFRFTYLLGLTLGFLAFSQVFALNLFFDVPVKLPSFHYLLAFVYLLLPYSRQFLNFFLLQKPTMPIVPSSLLFDKKYSLYSNIFKYMFVVYILYIAIYINFSYFKQTYLDPNPALYGIYSVEEISVNKKVIEPLLSNKDRWQYVIFDKEDQLYIHKIGRSGSRFKAILDTESKKITLTSKGMTDELNWDYELVNNDEMIIKGMYKEQEFVANLKKLELSQFNLWNNKFNWIQEYPNNR